MRRLSLLKSLFCSVFALNLVWSFPSVAGNLTKQYEDAHSLDERMNIAKTAKRKYEKLANGNDNNKADKAKKKLKTWEARLEEIKKKKASSKEEHSANLFQKNIDQIGILPREIFLYILSYLSPKTLLRIAPVSRAWNEASKDEGLWRPLLQKMGFKDPIFSKLTSRSIVICALKRSTVNSLLTTIITEENIIAPKGIITRKETDKLIELGYEKAREIKIIGLLYGKFGYSRDVATAKTLSKKLVGQGAQELFSKKISRLDQGLFSRLQDMLAAKTLNKAFVSKENRSVIERNINLTNGAKALNGKLVNQGDPEGIARMIVGYITGHTEYAKSPKFFQTYIDLSSNN